MDLREEILKEHSKTHTLKITHFIGDDRARFDELMDLFLNDEYRVAQRSAWVVSHCAEAHPHLILPHLESMIHNLRRPKLHDAVKRNTVKILAELNPKLSEDLQGHSLDICFDFLASQKEPVAIKVHSMRVIFNLCQKEPDLLRELKLVIEDQMPYGSGGFISCGRKILGKVDQILKRKGGI